MPTYAASTDVTSDRSRAEIERTLRRYGATSFAYGWGEDMAMIAFQKDSRQIRFELPMPDPKDKAFLFTETRRQRRTDSAAEAAYEQAVRQRWRALALVIKAKLEAVEAGITTFDDEFLAHMVLPGGATVGQMIGSQLPELLSRGSLPALMPGVSDD